MIRDITITSKGDYQTIRFSREDGSSKVDMAFNYSNGCSFASFDLADMEKAIEILSSRPRMTFNMNGNADTVIGSVKNLTL